MIVYLDLVFLTNMLLDYILLWITGKILQKNKSRIRLLVAAMFGGLTTALILIVPIAETGFVKMNIVLSTVRILTGIIILRIAFQIRRFREMLIALILLYGLSFLFAGLLNWFSNWFLSCLQIRYPSKMIAVSFAGMLLFAVLFFARFYAVLSERFFRKQYSVPVLIQIGNKQADGRGLLDSGNSLIEPITHKPVVVVEQEFLKKHDISSLDNGFFAIPYHALGTDHGILKGFLADEIHILGDDGERVLHKVMIGIYEGKLSMRGDYQILLHPDL